MASLRLDLPGRVGFPVHECVGHIADPGTSADLQIGQRVLAMPADECGLAQIYLARRDGVHPVRATQLTDAQATLIQPLSTVLYAIDRLSRLVDVAGARVAILGLGPIGLICAHVLSRRGALITGVDPIARSHAITTAFGVTDHLQDSATSRTAPPPGQAAPTPSTRSTSASRPSATSSTPSATPSS